MASLLLMSMDRVDGEIETLVEEATDLPAMLAVTPLASWTSAGCMTSSQPLGVQLCGLNRAVAGDGGLGVGGQRADGGAAGSDDGGKPLWC